MQNSTPYKSCKAELINYKLLTDSLQMLSHGAVCDGLSSHASQTNFEETSLVHPVNGYKSESRTNEVIL